MLLEDKYNEWLKSFKKNYKKNKPKLIDAFRGAYIMAVEECLDKPNLKLSKQEIDALIENIMKKKYDKRRNHKQSQSLS